jgi:PncC family amidohydrolase
LLWCHGGYIFQPMAAHDSIMERDLQEAAHRVVELLTQRGLTIAVAEATGCGLLGHLLTSVPGSSKSFLGGVAPYSRQAKLGLLGMDAGSLDKHGSVSEESALQMVRRVRQVFGADIGLAETGVAGPGGGSAQKPVGLVHIAISSREGKDAGQAHNFAGDRQAVRQQTVLAALSMAESFIMSSNVNN